jgi:hypothetical protein
VFPFLFQNWFAPTSCHFPLAHHFFLTSCKNLHWMKKNVKKKQQGQNKEKKNNMRKSLRRVIGSKL